MKTEDFNLLEGSMAQALAFKNGDETAARVMTIEKPDDATIRECRLRLALLKALSRVEAEQN